MHVITKLLLNTLILHLFFTLSSQTLIDYRSLLNLNRVCTSGKLQSPINLVESQSTYQSDIEYLSDDYKVVIGSFQLGSDGSSYTLTANPGKNFGSVFVKKNGYLTKNLLIKLVLNFPSEHSINGVLGDLEVKLIHQRDLSYVYPVNQYRQLDNANLYFTISILFKRGATYDSDNNFLTSLFPGWNSSYYSGISQINLDINATGLIREKLSNYYITNVLIAWNVGL